MTLEAGDHSHCSENRDVLIDNGLEANKLFNSLLRILNLVRRRVRGGFLPTLLNFEMPIDIQDQFGKRIKRELWQFVIMDFVIMDKVRGNMHSISLEVNAENFLLQVSIS